MRPRAAAALAILAAAGPAVADEGPATWTQRKAIALPALAGPAFVEVVLDDEVYRDATPGLGDLRVRDRDGRDVGYVLRRHERAARWDERPLPVLDLAETPGREVRFVLDVPPAAAGARLHDRVRIRVAPDAKNFRVPVRIETSADRREWLLVRAAGFIYTMEGESRAADTTVSYPPSSARYVRVSVSQPRGRAIPVVGAAIILETPAERDEDVRAATVGDRRDDAKARATRLLLELGGRRPVDRLELTVGDRTFSRVVFVEAAGALDAWRPVGSGSVSAIQTSRVQERHTGVRFQEVTARRLRLTIDNGDDRPLDLQAVRVATVRRGAVFEAVPGQAYALDYGHPRAPAPRYDLARAFPYLAAETLPVATLGPARPIEPPAARWRDSQVVVWAAMGVVALALAGLLLRLARQLKPAARG